MFGGRPGRSQQRLSTSPFSPPAEVPVPRFEVGDRVHHDAYGLGRVTVVEEAAGAVTVDFGTASQRIVAPYSRLSRL